MELIYALIIFGMVLPTLAVMAVIVPFILLRRTSLANLAPVHKLIIAGCIFYLILFVVGQRLF